MAKLYRVEFLIEMTPRGKTEIVKMRRNIRKAVNEIKGIAVKRHITVYEK